MLTSVAAQAQTAAQDTGVSLEQVVVTAQKRSENLQDVPVSIQAMGEAKLEQLQISNFVDYVKYLPSVSFTTSGPGFGQVYMRGVASGGDGNHSGSLPSVGVYLDEQPISTIQGALDIHVYDIARVEALAGPQGTLYGASSQAGTLRIITNKPSTAGYSAGVDFEFNQVDGDDTGHVEEAFVNIPLSDTVAVRLVGWNEETAGYIDNVKGTRTYTRGDADPTNDLTISNAGIASDNYNGTSTKGYRAALKVELGDNWVITPQVMGQRTKTSGIFAYDPKVGDLEVTHFYPEASDDKWTQTALTIEGQIANLDVTYAGSFLKRDVDTRQDYSDYSYFYDQVGYGFYWTNDTGGLANPSQYITGHDGYKKESHEFRIATPDDKRLRFIGGVFYQRQQHNITQRYKIDGISHDIEVPGYSDTIWLTAQQRVDRDYAGFGEVTFDITPKLTAMAGVRFFKSDNSLEGFYGYGTGYGGTGERACFRTGGVNGAPCTNLDKRVKETGNVPKVTVTYKFDSNKLAYVTYSEGFRPGGINRRSTLPPYQADYLKNYEFGWKTSWLENRIRWNGAAFIEDWKNFQFSILGANGLTEIKNANQARIKGLESDVTLAVTHGFVINGSAAYTDAKLTANYCGETDSAGNPITVCPARLPNGAVNPDFPNGPQAPDGTVLPVTPKFKANLTARYDFDLGPYESYLQASAVYQSGNWTDLRLDERAIIGRQASYTLVDVSGGVTRDDWSMSVYIKNITDKRASLGRYAECAESVCGAQTYITPNQPRTVGLKVGRKF
jgi:outer membrane receptor protein involved in Fe transport